MDISNSIFQIIIKNEKILKKDVEKNNYWALLRKDL